MKARGGSVAPGHVSGKLAHTRAEVRQVGLGDGARSRHRARQHPQREKGVEGPRGLYGQTLRCEPEARTKKREGDDGLAADAIRECGPKEQAGEHAERVG